MESASGWGHDIRNVLTAQYTFKFLLISEAPGYS